MTQEEAKEICIEKWKYIVEAGGDDEFAREWYLDDTGINLNNFRYNCPYCTLYVKEDEDGSEFCYGCPIDPPKSTYTYVKENLEVGSKAMKYMLKGCCQGKHPYSIWEVCPSKDTALEVLKLIENS